MLASGLSIFFLVSAALLGQSYWMRASARAKLQPVRVRFNHRERDYR